MTTQTKWTRELRKAEAKGENIDVCFGCGNVARMSPINNLCLQCAVKFVDE